MGGHRFLPLMFDTMVVSNRTIRLIWTLEYIKFVKIYKGNHNDVCYKSTINNRMKLSKFGFIIDMTKPF